jgi:CBS-domain-containing membrane protein
LHRATWRLLAAAISMLRHARAQTRRLFAPSSVSGVRRPFKRPFIPATLQADAVAAGIGSSLGVLFLILLAGVLQSPLETIPLVTSSVLIFGAPESPFAQPRNVIGGHLISAASGCACVALFGGQAVPIVVATAFAVSLMTLTRTFHPPAGANPVIVANIGAPWFFLLTPVAIGAVGIVLCAMAYFYAIGTHQYPAKSQQGR